MRGPELSCRDDQRRAKSRGVLNGIDYVEVHDDQRVLELHFFQDAPADLQPDNILITGGSRIPRVKVVDLRPCTDEQRQREKCLHAIVEHPGDFSIYTLRLARLDEEGEPTALAPEGFDPRYAQVRFGFKASCPSNLDCAPVDACAPTPRTEPEIDYLAKDYASFRQLILDRLAVIMPGWTERHVPDIGIALVELLAYVGDYLSYYQDAVATEAYLNTARRRISVRRHARLVDYQLHEGTNARAWIHIWTALDFVGDQALHPRDVYFISADTDELSLHRRTLTEDDLRNVPFDRYEVFEPVDRENRIALSRNHREIRFHTWGLGRCCLPKGATKATLKVDHRGLTLAPGDYLLFEEIRGPETGAPGDADVSHRHVVRLTSTNAGLDPIGSQAILEIEWHEDDALPFPLCISAIVGDDCRLEDISVARGNMVLVDHGRTIAHESLGVVPRSMLQAPCEGANCPGEFTIEAGRFAPSLQSQPLTFAVPFEAGGPASALVTSGADPRAATPAIWVTSVPPEPGGAGPLIPFEFFGSGTWDAFADTLRTSVETRHQYLRSWLGLRMRQQLDARQVTGSALREALAPLRQRWDCRSDLLRSTAHDRHFTVEIDNDRRAHLRFGDGALGREPAAGTAFGVTYRVGCGVAGNVGAERITHLVFRAGTASGIDLRPRNPLPAVGGRDPETLQEAKVFAPHRFRTERVRAITADDYAEIAERHPKVQRAAGVLRWTGNGHEALVAIDQQGRTEIDPALLTEIENQLDPFRRINHSVRVIAARHVPLLIRLTVCVLPHYLRGHVEEAVLDVLSNRQLADGRRGLFHPDILSFGQPVFLSPIVAAVQAIEGIETVAIDQLERLFDGPAGEIHSGLLSIGPLEIARLDNDPSLPENGRLQLTVRGGR